jgi:hypothetical protein
MAYSLRLPPQLDAAARARADYLGISLNSLLCVALDAYLRTPEPAPTVPTEPGPPVPRENPSPVQTKAQRKEFTRLQRLARKSG